MPARRLLLITYPWPPMPTVGANRWTALARHLARFDIDTDVLTTRAFGSLPDDSRNGVFRAGDLVGNRRLRSILRRPDLPVAGTPADIDTPPPVALTAVVPPDMYAVSWGPAALRRALAIVDHRRPDVLVSTSPYESTHLIALAVAKRTGLPWIADFRDGWTFEAHRRPFPLALQRRADAAMERAVARRADVILAATLPIAEDFRDRLGASAVHVSNAWDPDLDAEVDATAADLLTPGRLSLVHTGRLNGGWRSTPRSPTAFMEGLKLAVRSDPALHERFEVVLASRLDSAEAALLATADTLDGVVRHVGELSRGEAIALQRAADALLLITSRNVGEATGKLFEYLGSGRPVLALAEGNEAARIVTATGTGVCVPPDDPTRIAAALADLVAGRITESFAPHDLDTYVQPGPARAVAEQVERAIELRRRD